MKTTILSIDHLSDEIYSFNLAKPLGFRYIAGQFAEISLAAADDQKPGNKRWFTLSSAPSEEILTFTTKIPTTKSDYKSLLGQLKPGDEVEISHPLGDFILPKLNTIPIVCLSGGMGCTPFRSILVEASYADKPINISLFSSFKSQKDVIFQDVFSGLGNRYHLYVNQRLDMQDVLKAAPDIATTYFFLAGPEGFIMELSAQLDNAAVPKKHIFTDAFIGL